MKPGALIERLKKKAPAPGYLFLGNEPYFRDRCRSALIQAVRGTAGAGDGAGDGDWDGDWDGIAEFDLRGQPLKELIDEARTLSLFCLVADCYRRRCRLRPAQDWRRGEERIGRGDAQELLRQSYAGGRDSFRGDPLRLGRAGRQDKNRTGGEILLGRPGNRRVAAAGAGRGPLRSPSAWHSEADSRLIPLRFENWSKCWAAIWRV